MSKRQTKMREVAGGLRRIYWHLSPYMPEQRGLILWSAFALIAATGMRLLEPWPLKLVIDRVVVIDDNAASSGIASIDALPAMSLLLLCAVIALATIGLRALFEYFSTIGFALAGSRILARLRHDLYRHLQRLSLRFHDQARTGDLTMRVVGDVGMMREAATTAVLPLATNLLILMGMAAIMLWIDWRLGLIALAPLPILGVATLRLGRRIQKVSREQRKREGGIAAATSEAMAGMRVVQALSLEDRMARTFEKHNSGSLTDGVKAKRLSAELERATDLLIGLSTALVLYFGALQVMRGRLTPGDLIVFITYLKNAFRPVRDFAKNSSRLAKATAAGERVVDLLEEQPDIVDMPDAVLAPSFTGLVRFEGVSFGYGNVSVVHDVDLSLAPGRMVALVGGSGAGKSTITSLLMRLYDPDAGRILIDGVDIRSYTLASLRGQISIVLQDSLLFSESVRDNIALARPGASDAEIVEAARLANADGFIQRLSDAYQTILSERGGNLSMGQRQRLAIARAALRQCPILILDEPTVGLDRENEKLVIDAIAKLKMGRTVLLVTHDLELAAEADEIAFIEGGRIAERGTHEALQNAGRGYAMLYRARRLQQGSENYAVAG